MKFALHGVYNTAPRRSPSIHLAQFKSKHKIQRILAARLFSSLFKDPDIKVDVFTNTCSPILYIFSAPCTPTVVTMLGRCQPEVSFLFNEKFVAQADRLTKDLLHVFRKKEVSRIQIAYECLAYGHFNHYISVRSQNNMKEILKSSPLFRKLRACRLF